ncbi:S8 family peptidase [Scleromatobacter humisilvae]|uniref:S8 family serine peptidase n=1 Tax=Scleromatobacter humisilvae TaxID=2897159 RepID=A0A9X1YN45_9BURK|nr:S8 family serine peptidase [Scleromatobacter humisilvae]MCK9687427.1 S8 family serine peptidase [Scleromatobacter humisilvae]
MRSSVRNAGLCAAMVVTGSTAGAQSAELFQAVPANTPIKPFVSRSADSTPVTVVVLLSGEPVAQVQRQLGRKLVQGERDSVIAARASEHETLRPSIERLGGKVLAHFHSALNGVKIKIPRNRIAALRALPGVVDVQAVGTYQRLNVNAIPLIGAPQVWQAPGNYRGEGVKIAIIDTGIDYTHANFGGPGTVAAFNAAKATDTLPADPSMFGPGAPKVKGGIDLVGDDYTGSNTPVPDPNPLDCAYTSGSVGHGSHVAGTATGFGVAADGTTYTGPYTAAAYTPGAFRIGPGVAPKADLYSVRVFGCSGNTNVVSEAIDWAVAHGVDVISMSLGSDFGNAGGVDAGSLAESTAVANATAAGILVVAASGNSGPVPYITSAPAVFEGAISVAATDALPGLPTASLALSGGPTLTVQNSNSGVFANGSNYPIRVLRNPDGTVSLGCNPNEYDPAVTGVSLTGKMVVTVRGNCARVYRAGAAQHFGAAAAAMINSSAGLPPYEGPIPGGAADPSAGNVYEPVTIPFFGVALADGPSLSAPSAVSAIANNTATLANPGFERIASFSSQGPRIGDSVLRPGVTAPGVSVASTASGSGNGFEILSGTSMATPGVAGVAALAKQAHPTWSQADLRAAIVQTASPSMMLDLLERNEGAGLVQALGATTTQAVVRTADESASFGFADLLADFSGTKTLTLHNTGPKAVQFNITTTKVSGPAGATVTTPPSVIVNANSDATFPVSLNVPASSVGGGTGFQDIGGYVQLTPSSSRLNGNVKLSVPYYLVAHSRSNLAVSQSGGTLNFSNAGGAIAGTPGFYTLGLYQPTPQGVTQADVRAVGARIAGSTVIFGVNTHNRTSTTLGFQEFDMCIDTSGGAGFTPNMILIGINGSLLSSSLAKSTFATAIFPTDANCTITGGGTVLFTITQPTDNSTLLLPVPTGTPGLGLTSANPRFKYRMNYFGPDGTGASMPGTGSFNAFTPAVTFSAAPTVAPNGSGVASYSVNSEINNSTALGVMVLAPDNVSGASQAALLPFQ